jgi:hypothetical protein
MLTLDEIEDSYDTAFLHTVEDLPDEQLRLMLDNLRELRQLAPPSLAASRARDIVAAVLEKRHPTPVPVAAPVPAPEPVAEELPPEPQPEPVAEEVIAEAPGTDETPQDRPSSPLLRAMHWFFG